MIKEHISNISRYGVSIEFITIDGKSYFFDSFYYKEDTLYGQKIEKLIGFLIPVQSVKKIHLSNKDASEMAAVL